MVGVVNALVSWKGGFNGRCGQCNIELGSVLMQGDV